ncbi:F-actin-monooxygenase MICAL2 [Pristis pectinata]|uniref:F-actin-monooxygenase MICAL2 n=1 Tax=Pristis pectinata TaxID=685728 RepID=UPI00223C8C33|nr:F-actin-monooxygenase MICAL2 [Pristis pectinata]
MGENDGDKGSQAGQLFENFVQASTFRGTLQAFHILCRQLDLDPLDHQMFYSTLKSRVNTWKAKALWSKLDKQSSHKEYKKGNACPDTQCLIIGAGPCGLRTSIELALLGCKVVVLEKRETFARNNVLHLWPSTIHDLRALGAKKFYGKFCAGSIDHISIRQLQLILVKVALLLGVEIHVNVEFVRLLEPPEDQETQDVGWRAEVHPKDHPVSGFDFDVIIGADGRKSSLQGFRRKEFRGKLAIAITANFINRNTTAEAKVEEISGVAFIFNQKFFQDLKEETGIDLENIVYYKDNTHYFVMTAKKQSLLDKGVIVNDYVDTEMLLCTENVNQEALLSYAREAADFATKYQLPALDFAMNHNDQPDVAMFDFTCMYASENASLVRERWGHQLLVALVGDSLLEPFWPMGTGCARGFLAALDTAWMVKRWAEKVPTLEILAERESIYRLLPQTTTENISKNFEQYTIDPASRYPKLNSNCVQPHQVRQLYITTDLKSCPLERVNSIRKSIKVSRHDSEIRPNRLLTWCQKQTESYQNVKITDLTSSWHSGLALCAIIHHFCPHLIDFDSLNKGDIANNNQLAFDIAEREFGISPVTTGKEMASVSEPDKLSMVMYLSKFYEHFRGNASSAASVFRHRKEGSNDVPALQSRQSNSLCNVINLLPRKRTPKEKKSEDKDATSKRRKKAMKDWQEAADPRSDGNAGKGTVNHNKVKSMASQLLAKFEENAATTSLRRQGSLRKEFPQNLGGSDICYFCKKRVYVMERLSADGKFFHRECFKCDFCATTLRLGAYAFSVEEGKFYCKPHFTYCKLNNKTRQRRNHPSTLTHKKGEAVPLGKTDSEASASTESLCTASTMADAPPGIVSSVCRRILSWPLRASRLLLGAPKRLSNWMHSVLHVASSHLQDNAYNYGYLYELLSLTVPLLSVQFEVLLHMCQEGGWSPEHLIEWVHNALGYKTCLGTESTRFQQLKAHRSCRNQQQWPVVACGGRWPVAAGGGQWRMLVAGGGQWSMVVARGGQWRPVEAGGGQWWPVVASGGQWKLVVASGGRWWPVVAGGGQWWPVGFTASALVSRSQPEPICSKRSKCASGDLDLPGAPPGLERHSPVRSPDMTGRNLLAVRVMVTSDGSSSEAETDPPAHSHNLKDTSRPGDPLSGAERSGPRVQSTEEAKSCQHNTSSKAQEALRRANSFHSPATDRQEKWRNKIRNKLPQLLRRKVEQPVREGAVNPPTSPGDPEHGSQLRPKLMRGHSLPIRSPRQQRAVTSPEVAVPVPQPPLGTKAKAQVTTRRLHLPPANQSPRMVHKLSSWESSGLAKAGEGHPTDSRFRTKLTVKLKDTLGPETSSSEHHGTSEGEVGASSSVQRNPVSADGESINSPTAPAHSPDQSSPITSHASTGTEQEDAVSRGMEYSAGEMYLSNRDGKNSGATETRSSVLTQPTISITLDKFSPPVSPSVEGAPAKSPGLESPKSPLSILVNAFRKSFFDSKSSGLSNTVEQTHEKKTRMRWARPFSNSSFHGLSRGVFNPSTADTSLAPKDSHWLRSIRPRSPVPNQNGGSTSEPLASPYPGDFPNSLLLSASAEDSSSSGRNDNRPSNAREMEKEDEPRFGGNVSLKAVSPGWGNVPSWRTKGLFPSVKKGSPTQEINENPTSALDDAKEGTLRGDIWRLMTSFKRKSFRHKEMKRSMPKAFSSTCLPKLQDANGLDTLPGPDVLLVASQFPEDESESSLDDPSEDKQKESGRRQRKVRNIALQQLKQEEVKRLHRAQIIQRQLQEVEEKQRVLEDRGVLLEKVLRASQSHRLDSKEEPQLMQKWFRLVMQKNVLVCYEAELIILARELELEDHQSRLQQLLRSRMAVEGLRKTEEEMAEEKQIRSEMLEVREQRDKLVALLRQQHQQEEKENQDLESWMLAKGYKFNWS